jgi:hypothetical protein
MTRTMMLLLALVCAGCSNKYVPDIKDHAALTWKQAGFEIIGYEGYNYGGPSTWGGEVWYTLRRIPDNGIIYDGCISKWDDEYHIYSITAIDAIKPRQVK